MCALLIVPIYRAFMAVHAQLCQFYNERERAVTDQWSVHCCDDEHEWNRVELVNGHALSAHNALGDWSEWWRLDQNKARVKGQLGHYPLFYATLR